MMVLCYQASRGHERRIPYASNAKVEVVAAASSLNFILSLEYSLEGKGVDIKIRALFSFPDLSLCVLEWHNEV
jgi:hypothetical protein